MATANYDQYVGKKVCVNLISGEEWVGILQSVTMKRVKYYIVFELPEEHRMPETSGAFVYSDVESIKVVK